MFPINIDIMDNCLHRYKYFKKYVFFFNGGWEFGLGDHDLYDDLFNYLFIPSLRPNSHVESIPFPSFLPSLVCGSLNSFVSPSAGHQVKPWREVAARQKLLPPWRSPRAGRRLKTNQEAPGLIIFRNTRAKPLPSRPSIAPAPLEREACGECVWFVVSTRAAVVQEEACQPACLRACRHL